MFLPGRYTGCTNGHPFQADKGTPIEVGPGQAPCIPRGGVHRFANHGKADAKALCVITPGAGGPLYFREVADVMNTVGGGLRIGPKWARSCGATA
jgi:hypothetical protein